MFENIILSSIKYCKIKKRARPFCGSFLPHFWFSYGMDLCVFYQLLNLDFSCFSVKFAFSFPASHVCSAGRLMFLRQFFTFHLPQVLSAFTEYFSKCVPKSTGMRIPQREVLAKNSTTSPPLYLVFRLGGIASCLFFNDNSLKPFLICSPIIICITFPLFLGSIIIMLGRWKVQWIHAPVLLEPILINVTHLKVEMLGAAHESPGKADAQQPKNSFIC